MTIRLYDKDVDMLDFSAVVKTCVQRENGYVVTLDQTAFSRRAADRARIMARWAARRCSTRTTFTARWSTWSARRWQSAARCAAMWTRRAGWT